jgi:pimeloyl-ACP methyl ester carboxylesterase
MTSKLHISDAGAGQPVLLLHSHGMSGRQWRRRVIERLREALPGARTTEVAGAGYLGPVTHAEVVNRILLEAH